MANLSQFFGSAVTAGGVNTTSTMRVFSETGSYSIPASAVYAAYGVMGGGGTFSQATAECRVCQKSGGGGGFSFKEGAQAGADTICAVIGQGGRPQANCPVQMASQGGTTCISGFDAGTICATGGCCNCPGSGSGGDINTNGGYGGLYEANLGGGGAGGLYGNGGDARSGGGGGGFGSGGGGGGGIWELVCCQPSPCQSCCFGPDVGNGAYWRNAQGGGGGQMGGFFSGGNGLNGSGGSFSFFATCNNCGVGGLQTERATGGYIPQYTKCGYSQAKTYFAAAGGGGAGVCVSVQQTSSGISVADGAPGGGGGRAFSCHGEYKGGHGGFGAGGGGGTANSSGGSSGFGGGASMYCYDGSSDLFGGIGGQGVAVIEFWSE
jgi:hypothetical protein